MTIAELLKQEKGKYTNYEFHYKEYAKYIPFTFINGRKNEDMKVVKWFYRESEGHSFGMDLKYRGKTKDKTLVIVWER